MNRECKFQEVLIKLMEDNNLSSYKMANKINTSAQVIRSWVKGYTNPSLYFLMEISEVFNVSVDYLIYGENYENVR